MHFEYEKGINHIVSFGVSLRLALLLVIVGSFAMLPAFAQTDTLIFAQNILRDSGGNLVTSLEVTKIGYLNSAALSEFLDAESSQNDPIFTMNGQKMQIIERQITLDFDSGDVISDTTLNTSLDSGSVISLVRLVHDGLPVTKGDSLTQIWTFIRPV